MKNSSPIVFSRETCLLVSLIAFCTTATQASEFQSVSNKVDSDKPAIAEKTETEVLALDDDETDEAEIKSVEEQLDELTAEYEAAMNEWVKKRKAVNSSVAAAKLMRSNPQLSYSPKFFAIYEANPDSKLAPKALRMTLEAKSRQTAAKATTALIDIATKQDPEQARKNYIAILRFGTSVKFGSSTAKREAADKLLAFAAEESNDAIALEMLKSIVGGRYRYKKEEVVARIWKRVQSKLEEADFESLALVGLYAEHDASEKAYAALLEYHSDHEDFARVIAVVPRKPHEGFEAVVKKVFKEGEGDAKIQAAISLAEYMELSHAYLDFEGMSDEKITALEKQRQDLKEFLVTMDGDSKLHQQARDEAFLLENLQPGLEALEIVGTDLKGDELKLSDYRGKVVLLSFWGNWCPPCKALFPHERSLTRTLADKPFTIIGVNSARKTEIYETVCEPKNLTWPNFADRQSESRISKDWRVKIWPTTYLIDKDGIIRYKGLRGEMLDIAIEKLLAEMDIEVNLKEIDHEAEDEKAMEAHREARKAAGFDDPTE